MKKFLLSISFALVAVCAICLAACGKDPESVDKPVVQVTEFVYSGNEITLLSDGEFYTVSGNKATDAGTYTATASLTDKKNYTWSDGTTDDVSIDWKINKATAEKPSATSTEYAYSGEEVTLISEGNGYTVSGNKATDAGSYTATASLTDKANYTWSDGTTDDVSISWKINKATVEKPVAASTEYAYSGEEVTVISAGNGYTVSENKATNAGSYTATASLTDKVNYTWADGTTGDVVINWTIKKLSVPVPTVSDSLVYTGNAITALPESDYYTVTEGTKTDAGSYLSTATLKDTSNCEWADGTTSVKRISWSIAKADYDTGTLVFEDASYVYDGNPHTLTIQGLPEGINAVYSTNSLTDVGSIEVTATFTASSNYNQTEMKATLTVTSANNTFATGLTGLDIYDEDEEALTVVYSGDPVSLNVVSAFGEPDVSYYTLADDAYTPVETPVNAGTYYVRATVTGTVNYSGLESDYVKLVIQKATYDLSEVEYVTEYEYDGNEHTVLVNNLPEGVTASVSSKSDVPCEIETTVSFTGDSENYNAIDPVTKTLIITNKIVMIKTYDELQHELLDNELNFTGSGQYIIYKLANDIDCNNQVWTVVGDYDSPFSSNLDGNNYTIKNMLINETSGKYIATGGGLIAYAMFGALGYAASVHDVTFDNFNVIVNTDRITGGNYYAFICGRIPNTNANTVELYNITIENSLININDTYRNKTRLGGIFGWDYSDDSRRENILIKNSDIIFVGEPDGQGSAPSGTCYIGGFAGEIDGNASNGFGRTYNYKDCTFEGGTIIVKSLTTQAPHIGGLFGYVIGTVKLTNVESDAAIYRFCGSKQDAFISEVTLQVTDGGDNDNTVKSLAYWIGRADSAMPTPTVINSNYTGTARILKNETSEIGINDTVTLNLQLPEEFSVTYLLGETEVNQISLKDFENKTSVTVTAEISYNDNLSFTLEQTYNLTYAFAENTEVGDEAIVFDMQLPEGFSVTYLIDETEVTQISREDFGENESVTVTAKINHNDELFCTLEQTFTVIPEENPDEGTTDPDGGVNPDEGTTDPDEN